MANYQLSHKCYIGGFLSIHFTFLEVKESEMTTSKIIAKNMHGNEEKNG
jgi:hypothetical protein